MGCVVVWCTYVKVGGVSSALAWLKLYMERGCKAERSVCRVICARRAVIMLPVLALEWWYWWWSDRVT